MYARDCATEEDNTTTKKRHCKQAQVIHGSPVVRMLQVCDHIKHVVVLVALHSCQHFTCCQLFPHIHFSPVCEFLADFPDSHTAKTGLLMCCPYMRWMKTRKCSWRKARERTTKDETCDRWQHCFWSVDATQIAFGPCRLEPSALIVRRCAVINCTCTNVSCEWVSCPHLPSIFWNSFQETEITTNHQMMWKPTSSNSSANVSLATAMLKMETLPCGTAIQFSDRHSNRSSLLPSNC